MTPREYIGDGVYISSNRGMIQLTAEDGVAVTDVIYLERDMLDSIVKYADKWMGRP